MPVHNERDNVLPLIEEIAAALRGRTAFEVVYVDDASRDDTLAVLREAKQRFPELRVVRHLSQSGQSTAVRTGIKHARGEWIATLDGDGQNEPADLPDMLAKARARLPGLTFSEGDVATWTPERPPDLLFANAVLQWLPDHATLLPRLFDSLAPGGVLALQMPDNLDEPSHRAMRELAAQPPWSAWRRPNSTPATCATSRSTASRPSARSATSSATATGAPTIPRSATSRSTRTQAASR